MEDLVYFRRFARFLVLILPVVTVIGRVFANDRPPTAIMRR